MTVMTMNVAIRSAIDSMLDGDLADRRDIFEDVFAEMPSHLLRQRDEMERLP